MFFFSRFLLKIKPINIIFFKKKMACCFPNIWVHKEIKASRVGKQHLIDCVVTGTAWIKKWVEFTDALEQSQLSATHWVEVAYFFRGIERYS